MITDIFAGTAGGVAVVLIGHPFDTTKTRLQTAPTGFYRNTIDCVRKTLEWEGTTGFYRGIYSPLAGQMLFRACSFATFYSTVSFFRREDGEELAPQHLMVAGALTGFMVSFIECPIDLVKTRLQVQIFQQQIDPSYVPKYTTVTNCVKYLTQKYGPSSLWRGLSGTLIRNIPANALFFPVNEMVKRELARRQNISTKHLSVKENIFAGSCAGLCYWVGTYPLDVIKAKMQSDVRASSSWWETAKTIYQNGGIRAFSRGFVPCALRAVPACGTMFATVDFVRNKLSVHG